jgi:hypothetical protein
MATGIANQPGGVAAPADVAFAGADQWAQLSGVSPMSPLVGGPGFGGMVGNAGPLPYNVDGHAARIVTNDSAPDASQPHLSVLDDWRDVLNFRGSPIPWLLLLTLVMLGFMQLRIHARAGKASVGAAIG